jgi:hypothetical protein
MKNCRCCNTRKKVIILLFVSVNSLAQRKAVVYGDYLPLGRRLSDSRSQTFGYNGISDWEVWTDEKAFFRRKS